MSDDTPELAEWKRRHGIQPGAEINHDEMRMAAEDAKSSGSSWCYRCADQFPVREMKLIPRSLDPYVQIYEGEGDYIPKGERIRTCLRCYKEEYEEDDDA